MSGSALEFTLISLCIQLADLFCNSVGILQQSLESGEKVPAPDEEKSGEGSGQVGGKEEQLSANNIELFTSLITRTAQDIDILIDSLPRSEYKAEMQVCIVVFMINVQTVTRPLPFYTAGA